MGITDAVHPDDLPHVIEGWRHSIETGLPYEFEQPSRTELSGPLTRPLQDQEKEMIETALAVTRGKVASANGAAAKVGIPPSTLESKIKQLKINKQNF